MNSGTSMAADAHEIPDFGSGISLTRELNANLTRVECEFNA